MVSAASGTHDGLGLCPGSGAWRQSMGLIWTGCRATTQDQSSKLLLAAHESDRSPVLNAMYAYWVQPCGLRIKGAGSSAHTAWGACCMQCPCQTSPVCWLQETRSVCGPNLTPEPARSVHPVPA